MSFFENIDEFFFCCKYQPRWYFHPEPIILIDSFTFNDYLASVFFSCFQKVKNSICKLSRLSEGKMTNDLLFPFLKNYNSIFVLNTIRLHRCVQFFPDKRRQRFFVHLITYDKSLHFT